MHDLLHTSSSCHFKICLKSHTTGITARRDTSAAFLAQFYLTPLQKMERGSFKRQPTVLGRSSRNRWSISHKPSSDFRAVQPYRVRYMLCSDRENDVKTAKDDQLGPNNHELMHAPIDIVEEFHREGVNKQTER